MKPEFECRDIIDHDHYPIDDPDDPRRKQLVDQVRAELAEDGCAVIRGFFSDAGLAALTAEAEARKSSAYYSPRSECNVYLNDGNPDFPADHPINVFMPRSNGFVTADLFGCETAARQLYHWPPLKDFLRIAWGNRSCSSTKIQYRT